MSELYDDVIEKYDSVANEIVSPEHKTCKTCNGLRRDSGTEIKRSNVAILVADVVDYCRLIEIDDLKTVLHLERLKRDVIAPIAWREGANIIRSFGGDGLVLSFADPLMAVRCAKKIQDKVRAFERRWSIDERIYFRIGIAMGPMLTVDGNLHGSPINVAARLQMHANPGDIWMADSAFRRVCGNNSVSFEPLGKVHLKNIKSKITAYRIKY